MKQAEAKERIIAAGMELIPVYGYNATGLDAILKKAGVPKGSFYHHFGVKENFGLALIEHFATEYALKLDSFLLDANHTPLKRIDNYLEHSIRHLEEQNFAYGCIAGNLGQELADQNERMRLRLSDVFKEWLGKFTACLEEAKRQGELDASFEPASIARFLLSGWEGAILQAKVLRSVEPLKNFRDVLWETVLRCPVSP